MTKLATHLCCLTSMEGAIVRDTIDARVRRPAPELASRFSILTSLCTFAPVVIFQNIRAHNITLVAKVLFEAAIIVTHHSLVAALVPSEIAKSWNRSHLGLMWGCASCIKRPEKLTATVSAGFCKVDLVTVEKLAIVWVFKVRRRMSPAPRKAGSVCSVNGQ